MFKAVTLLVVWLLSVPVFCRGGQFADEFAAADSVAAAYAGYPVTNLDGLATNLTNSLSTQQGKFRAIFRWVCDNISYDHRMFMQNKKMRAKLIGQQLAEWNNHISKEMFAELARRRTVCTGYAWLVRELAVRAGLSCVMVDGYGRNALSNLGGEGTPNHSWNAVQLNGLWYLCDATWAAGVFDMNDYKFVHKFNEGYFLTKPSLFVLNHYPLDRKWTLMNHSPSLRKFLDGVLIYNSTARYGIQPTSPQNFDTELARGDTLRISFDMPNARCSVITMRVSPIDAIQQPVISSSALGDRVTFDRRFSSRGTYTINVLVDINSVLSYRVKVK